MEQILHQKLQAMNALAYDAARIARDLGHPLAPKLRSMALDVDEAVDDTAPKSEAA